MARFYLAGPLFTMQDRTHLERIAALLEDAGHSVFLPHRDGADDAATRGPEDDAAAADARRQKIFTDDMAGLAAADGVIALLDGPDCDAGTAFELGWAFAHRRPILGLRTDFRTLGPEGPVSLMLYASADRFLHEDAGDWERIAETVQDWAKAVRPYGGRLVRDAVPKILESKGRPLPVRAATDTERPIALKSKVREIAIELATSDPGAEPELLADLLEATEAFIRARRFDKQTLKAVKAQRWKERGGYDKAWIVDVAPTHHEATADGGT